jgi:selenocysteine lyase/cysteine desulfurase
VVDVRPITKLVHDAGGLVIVDHTAAAPYRLLDIEESGADVVALNAAAWGGPPIGALVFRDPDLIETFTTMSHDPRAAGPGRLEMGAHQFGLLPVSSPASSTWRTSTRSDGDRRTRLAARCVRSARTSTACSNT